MMLTLLMETQVVRRLSPLVEALPELNVGLVHGRMKAQEKADVIHLPPRALLGNFYTIVYMVCASLTPGLPIPMGCFVPCLVGILRPCLNLEILKKLIMYIFEKVTLAYFRVFWKKDCFFEIV